MTTGDPIEDIMLDEAVVDPIDDADAADRDNKLVDSQVESRFRKPPFNVPYIKYSEAFIRASQQKNWRVSGSTP